MNTLLAGTRAEYIRIWPATTPSLADSPTETPHSTSIFTGVLLFSC